jgi:hypothetical protein
LVLNGTVESEIWKAQSSYAIQSRQPNRLSVQQGVLWEYIAKIYIRALHQDGPIHAFQLHSFLRKMKVREKNACSFPKFQLVDTGRITLHTS